MKDKLWTWNHIVTVICKKYDEFLKMIINIEKKKSSNKSFENQIFIKSIKFITNININANEQNFVKINFKKFQQCWNNIYKCFSHLFNQTSLIYAFLTLHKIKTEKSEKIKS